MTNSNSRTRKSIKNIFWGIFYQALLIILNFVLRSIFIKKLSAEYLGVNGLFSNILSVLSLAELGIGNAIIYTMYKPLKENNEKEISSILNFYKKIYAIIGTIIFLVGILLIPFLKQIVKLENEMPNLRVYYILYLLNTVSSYFLVAKTSIFTADQKDYVLKKINISFNIVKFILQAILLIAFNSYLLYLLAQIVITIMNNMINLLITYKKYPFLRKQKEKIKLNTKKIILNNVKSLFLYQFGGVILNNTDNILISMICGTVNVGLYSNYSIIISSVENVISNIFTATLASIGNYNVDNSEKERYKLFNILDMISYWLYGCISIIFGVAINDFIEVWIGKDYILGNSVVIISVVNFYLRGILYPILCFRNTTTLFKKTKYIMLYASVINIVLSIFLGLKIGLTGILIATALSRILTNIWYEPKILFKEYFKENVFKYYLKKLFQIIGLSFVYIIIFVCCKNIVILHNNFVTLIFKCIISLIMSNIYFILIFYRKKEFKIVISKFMQLVKNKIAIKSSV